MSFDCCVCSVKPFLIVSGCVVHDRWQLRVSANMIILVKVVVKRMNKRHPQSRHTPHGSELLAVFHLTQANLSLAAGTPSQELT